MIMKVTFNTYCNECMEWHCTDEFYSDTVSKYTIQQVNIYNKDFMKIEVWYEEVVGTAHETLLCKQINETSYENDELIIDVVG